jgi:hypothetical protein
MANEAVFLEIHQFAPCKQYTCAAGTSISKGTLLKLSGDNTVIASSASDVYAGVAAMDKDGTDSSTKISVYVPFGGNKFDMKCASGAVTLGAVVVLSGANLIRNAVEADLVLGKIIGTAQEAGTADEVISVLS